MLLARHPARGVNMATTKSQPAQQTKHSRHGISVKLDIGVYRKPAVENDGTQLNVFAALQNVCNEADPPGFRLKPNLNNATS